MSLSVLLLESIHLGVQKTFSDCGYVVKSLSFSLSESNLISLCQSEHINVLGVRSKTVVSRRVLEACPDLALIGCFCIGTDTVDLEAAREFGVVVFNAPFSSGRSVAELCLGEIICLSRQLCDKSGEMHRGVWSKSSVGCHEIRGRVLGVVGYGNIGCQISILAEAFGMQVLYFDIASKTSIGNSKSCSSLESVLKESDFVTLHVPDTHLTRGMIGKDQIGIMKPGSLLLNASRGGVVDLDALREALLKGHLGGCAIDVHPDEPISNTQSWISPLQGLKNVILTPHIGGSTEQAQERIGLDLSSKIKRFVESGEVMDSVNFPTITLSSNGSKFRICHIHRNVPGVLKKLNTILDSVNIVGQSLNTQGQVGICLLDCDQVASKEAIQEIWDMAETIRVYCIPEHEDHIFVGKSLEGGA